MKNETDTAPATGANPSTLTTAGQPAHLSPEQIDQAAPEAESAPKLTAVEDQPVRTGAMLVDERRFYGALRILHDAIVAMEATSIEDEGAHAAMTVLSDVLRDAADLAKIGN